MSANPVRHLGWCLPLVLGFVVATPTTLLRAATNVAAVTDAARAGDLTEVQKLIKEHADINAVASDGSSALLWAAYHSDAEMTKALLAAGAEVDLANHYGVTPLLQASRLGDVEVMKALLNAGADATRWHEEGETPLMAAAKTGKVDAVKLLLDKGAFVNAADPFQQETALMWASAEGHLEVVKALLAAGADPNLKAHVTTIDERSHADHPSGGFTALMFAVREGHEEVAKALVAGKADLKATDADGATATIIAIYNDRFDLAKELLDLGSDPNDGSLYWAVDMHDATTDMHEHDGSRLVPTHENTLSSLSLIKALVDLGADVNKPFVGTLHSSTLCCGPSANASPFYRAAQAADVEVLKVMLAHGAKLDWTPTAVKPKEGQKPPRGLNGNVGKTAVMVAMAGGNGAPFGGGPGFSRVVAPPFREAGSREPVEALKLLLAAGADPNVKAPDGTTALHQAVTLQQVPMIKALVEAGAKLDAVDKKNQTPLIQADKMKNVTFADIAAVQMTDPDAWHRPRNDKSEVVAALREAMHLGPNDPIPAAPNGKPARKALDAKDDGKDGDAAKAPEAADKATDEKAAAGEPAARPARGAAAAAASEE
jgi:ankyrin repeat protein